jgi:hypothetical protein
MARKAKAEDTTSFVTSVRLPRDLHKRLAQASGERGVGEEIRRRLEASFTRDPAIAEFLEGAAEAASTLALDADGGPSADAWSFQTFKAVLDALAEKLRPKDEAKATHHVFDEKKDEPATAARIIIGANKQAHLEKRKG